MKTIFHILSSFINPAVGGMEESILRISGHLASMGRTQVIIYTRNEPASVQIKCSADNIRIKHLKPGRNILTEPLNSGQQQNDLSERYRIDALLLRNAVSQS